MKKTAKMERLKITYSQRIGIYVLSLRFCFNGVRIMDDETLETLEMEQDDVIDVFHVQPWHWDDWVGTNSLTYRQSG